MPKAPKSIQGSYTRQDLIHRETAVPQTYTLIWCVVTYKFLLMFEITMSSLPRVFATLSDVNLTEENQL